MHFQGTCIHAGADVRDGDHDVLSSFYRLGELLHVSIVEVSVRGFNRHFAAVRHCIARVQHKIENGVFQLIDIRLRYPKPARQDGFQSDGFAHHPAK